MKQYGLIGFPLRHSFSKSFLNEKFQNEGIEAEYINFELPNIESFPSIIKQNPLLEGLNVTIPYKEKIIPYLDSIDDEAKEIGAVNVIKFIHHGDKLHLRGYNSDVIGFRDSIKTIIQDYHTGALVLGTGGASKAIAYVLRRLGLEVKFVSREEGKGDYTYEQIDEALLKYHQIIVNTTPVGMFPNVEQYPKIPYSKLSAKHILYDLIYNPNQTEFMRRGEMYGAKTKNGLEMLLLQAYSSLEIWEKKEE